MRTVLLALALTLVSTGVSVADGDNEIGRYTIVPMPGHDALILLDTKTGQNWYSGDVVEHDRYAYENGALRKKGMYNSLAWRPNPFAKWADLHY